MLKRITQRHLIGGGFALVIFIVAFAVIWGAWRNSIDNTPVILENPGEVYADAIYLLENTDDVFYRVTASRQITVGKTILDEEYTQNITQQDKTTGQPQYLVEENTLVGDYTIPQTLLYANGIAYSKIQDAAFQTAMDEDTFLMRITPAAPITPELYSEISGFSNRKETRISFSGATAVESWVSSNALELTDAQADVIIDPTGRLISSEYRVKYTCNSATFVYHIETEITYKDVPAITTPNEGAYTTIDSLTAPYLLEKATGYLINASNIRSEYTDRISCQAFGDERSQTIKLDVAFEDTFQASINTMISLSNNSKAGVVTTTTTDETYKDGLYSLSADGGEFVPYPDVTMDTVNSYCENILIGTVMLPAYIANTELTQTDTLYCINFKATDTFAKLLAEEACTTLYQKPDVLAQLSQASTTDSITCYLHIDRVTGFPVAAGFDYAGTYTISDLPYALTFSADQTYQLIQ